MDKDELPQASGKNHSIIFKNRIICPLLHVNFEESCKFEENITISPLSDSLRKGMEKHLSKDIIEKYLKMCKWILTIPYTKSDRDLKFRYLHAFTIIMRLLKWNLATVKYVFYTDDTGEVINYEEKIADIYGNGLYFVEGFNFDRKDVCRLSEIWRNYYRQKAENRIENALVFKDIADHYYYWELKLVIYTTALECLFSTERQELAFQMSTRMAWFLGKDDLNRKKIYKDIKRIYNRRSEIVHGSISLGDKSEGNDTESLCIFSRQYLTDALLKILEDRELIIKFTGNTETLREYFNNLILNQKRGRSGEFPFKP